MKERLNDAPTLLYGKKLAWEGVGLASFMIEDPNEIDGRIRSVLKQEAIQPENYQKPKSGWKLVERRRSDGAWSPATLRIGRVILPGRKLPV